MMKMDEPDKFDLQSCDITEDKRLQFLRLFPEIRTEGGKLDFERLKLALGEAVEVGKERYGMTWPGKAECFKTIQHPSLGTRLNMMYPRLYLARNLLREDGIIFISIDDHEDSNLKKLCDEVFGEENCLAQFSWRTDGNFDNQAKFKRCHEYVLVFAKNETNFPHPPVIDPTTRQESKLFLEDIRKRWDRANGCECGGRASGFPESTCPRPSGISTK